MTSHEIFVSVLRKHLIGRKIAEQIATEIDAAIDAECDRKVQDEFGTTIEKGERTWQLI